MIIILNRCKVPECDADDGSYLTSWLNYSVPFVSNSPEKCKKYQFLSNDENASCSIDSFNRSAIETCSSFIYENNEITIQSEVRTFSSKNINTYPRTTIYDFVCFFFYTVRSDLQQRILSRSHWHDKQYWSTLLLQHIWYYF
jgi:hypothetical protein